MNDFYSAVIAGTHSGAGKTTWSLALMSWFRKKGWTVQPFKSGPDYIDPGFHHLACAPRKSRNLDLWMIGASAVKKSYERNCRGANLSLIEGVMGLFDGRSSRAEEGSTAQLAKYLNQPVLLVVDGGGMARSAAAIVKGCKDFDLELNLKGVLLNNLGSENHFRWLKDPIEHSTGVPVLGWLPRDASMAIPERHLGLRTAPEENWGGEQFSRIAGKLEGRFDEKLFLDLIRSSFPPPATNEEKIPVSRCRIGIARDKAFSFYYEDNLDLLRQAGAELIPFSPLSDKKLPEELDALYLGGGFPEVYAPLLSENRSFLESLKKFHSRGGMIYAECGGLMYLAEAGILPGKIRMAERLQRFGYHDLETCADTFLFPAGQKLRSHEFHYSVWETAALPAGAPYLLDGRAEGYYDGQVFASYQHIHFGQDPELASRFTKEAARRSRTARSSDAYV